MKKLNIFSHTFKPRAILLVGLMFCITLFLIGNVSAMFPTQKEKIDLKQGLKISPSADKYPAITIQDWFDLPLIGKDIADLVLTEHTETCDNDCSSQMQIKIYEDNSLIDDVKFYTINGKAKVMQPIKNYQFYIQTDTKKERVDDYEKVCKDIINTNGTTNVCDMVLVGNHFEDMPVWKEYKIGEKVKAGTYNLRLEGEKRADRSVDWIIKTQGQTITDWAMWSNTDLNQNLTLWYSFDEGSGTIAKDRTQQKNGTLVNAPEYSTRSKLGTYAMRFNNTANRVVIPDNYFNNMPDGTISAWIYYNSSSPSVNKNFYIFSKEEIGVLSHIGLILNKTDGLINFVYGAFSYWSNTSAVDNAYNHFVFTWDGSNVKMYLNGTMIMNQASAFTIGDSADLPTYIGNEPSGATNARFENEIDEFAIWNMTLTKSQVQLLYNSGAGILTNPYGLSSLITPLDNNYSSSSLISHNCSANIIGLGTTLVNASLWDNRTGTWTRNQTNLMTGTYNSSIFTNNYVDSQFDWTCEVCDSDGACGFSSENRTLTIDTTKPSINIIYPSETISYGYLGQNSSLNYSISDTNIGSCWYEYQGVNTTLSCTANTTFLLNSSKSLTIYANDTAGNINSTTKSWNYSIFENNISYLSSVIEGESTQITANFSLVNSPSSIILVYNGTNYTPSVLILGNEYYLVSSVQAPLVNSDKNISFYYIIITGSNYQNSSQLNQSVSNVGISTSCGAGTYPFINIFNYDEDLLNAINGTVEYALTLVNGNYQIASASNSSTGINISLCLSNNISTSLATFSLELRYYKNDSTTFYETYNIQNNPGSETPLNISLYYLNSSRGTQFKINYQDFYYLTHPGAIIQVQRQYLSEDIYRIVELPKIADNGQSIASFSTNNIRYKIIVINNGVILDTFENVFPSCQNIVLGTCELNLRGTKTSSTETIGDFTYTLAKTNSSIVLTYIIPSETPKLITLFANQNSRFMENITTCNSSIFASGGTISCDYNNTIGDSIVDLQILTNGEDPIYGSITIAEDLSTYFLGNNFFIAFILLLSLGLMFISSAVMLVVIAVIGVLYLGLIFLLKGVGLTTVATSVIWLIIASIIIIFKVSQKEERS